MTYNPLPSRNTKPELDIHQLARIHDLARACAPELRRAAIGAFWQGLFAMLQRGFPRSPRKTVQFPQ